MDREASEKCIRSSSLQSRLCQIGDMISCFLMRSHCLQVVMAAIGEDPMALEHAPRLPEELDFGADLSSTASAAQHARIERV